MSSRPHNIPDHLANQLEDPIRQALQHPSRRRILRAMQAANETLSPAELVRTGKVDLPISNVTYHVWTLGECGLVADVEQEVFAGGRQEHCFAPQISDNDVVLEVLRATETSDNDLKSATPGT